jgi:hypothetical protein
MLFPDSRRAWEMNTNRHAELCAGVILAGAVLVGAAYSQPPSAPSPLSIKPAAMSRIGSVDERFQSFNVEMVEVIGGRFWKPYDKEVDALLKVSPSAGPVGMDPAHAWRISRWLSVYAVHHQHRPRHAAFDFQLHMCLTARYFNPNGFAPGFQFHPPQEPNTGCERGGAFEA